MDKNDPSLWVASARGDADNVADILSEIELDLRRDAEMEPNPYIVKWRLRKAEEVAENMLKKIRNLEVEFSKDQNG